MVAQMARDYLLCSRSSAALERTLSAAADICSAGRVGMTPVTIEMYVSTRMWLVKEVSLGDQFSSVMGNIKIHDFV